MKKYVIGGVTGLISGIILSLITIYQLAAGLMIREDVSAIPSFAGTTARFEMAVENHGWKIPKVHDLQQTMAKFGRDVKAVKVYDICHPDHAGKILAGSEERIVSSLMPCRVAIYEKNDGRVYVSRLNSGLMGSMMEGIIPEVTNDASRENEEILKSILD